MDTEIFQNQIIRYNEFTTLKTKYEQMPIYAQPSKYCKIDNMNDYKDMGYGYFGVKYKFDKESFTFFNEPNYIFYNWKQGTLHQEHIKGIKVEDVAYPCKTRYIYGGEAGGIYGSTEKKVLNKFDKKEHVIYNKKTYNKMRGNK